jgi:Kdo2-lipid IVA lauroyltransferase/acyltransferase
MASEPSPAATRTDADWPVPWQPVWGESDGLGSRLGTLALRAVLFVVLRLPEFALQGLLSALAGLGARFGRRRSRAAREFLRQALGELPEAELARRVRQGWLHLLRVSVDTERLTRIPRERLRERYDVRMSPAARRVLEAHTGCLLVTGHVGNWEAAFAVLPALGFGPAYGVAKPPKNKSLSQSLQANRERWGVRVLSRKGAMVDAPTILRAGGSVSLVIDQRTSGRALLVPFFGRLARCERAPAVLLKRQRVPIVLVSCRMAARPLHYEFEFDEVLTPEEWGRRSVEDIVLRINQGLERLIRADPEQYVWIHDRYRDTPSTLDPGAGARLARGPRGAASEEPAEGAE